MSASPDRPIQPERDLSILQRVAERDKTAVQDCVNAYGNFIWTLAKKFTASTEEAEVVVQEIFADIWRDAECMNKTQNVEKKLIAMIALRRLIKPLR